ncbi:hypothetical protein E4631_18450 [Hymenobacter sp. UV11]|uniref:hypothetical protein n=1 Tax=Hymenobacter sp. UV11 TaxID=1849735 RepID=UPI00105D85F9|nr:hypothetical protein [Hymenobacter sp. UV11]TDN36403.1 hypothetical protein A8B98_08550 [Hymenobacter sp. UV11]TFZ64501.1 hypothetical protein E4631_18450 [Hymenobacter sp. UV11]
MNFFSNLIFAAFAGFILLATPALAQKAPKEPPTLLGRWQTRQIAFTATAATPDSVRDQLDDPEIADLNQAIFMGEAQLIVDFRADGSYQFTINRDGRQLRLETGTYSLANGHLQASSPGSADGSSFSDQQVLKLARRTLVLVFPVGPELPGVDEEIEYRRVGPYPLAEK